jgi:hypothetical protein
MTYAKTYVYNKEKQSAGGWLDSKHAKGTSTSQNPINERKRNATPRSP